MWTKNAGKNFHSVLAQLDHVLPSEAVCCKILVDDDSKDETVEVAEKFGWNIYPNPSTGISCAANFALKKVHTEFYASFEQDIFLSPNWWSKITRHFRDKTVGCAQGIRIQSHPLLRVLDEETQRKIVLTSMDNNLFRTEAVYSVGGYSTLCPCCVDAHLYKMMTQESSYRWIFDRSIVSTHIRDSLANQIRHQHWFSKVCTHSKYCGTLNPLPFSTSLRITVTSPLRGMQLALKKQCPQVVLVYPYLRLVHLKDELAMKHVAKGKAYGRF